MRLACLFNLILDELIFIQKFVKGPFAQLFQSIRFKLHADFCEVIDLLLLEGVSDHHIVLGDNLVRALQVHCRLLFFGLG